MRRIDTAITLHSVCNVRKVDIMYVRHFADLPVRIASMLWIPCCRANCKSRPNTPPLLLLLLLLLPASQVWHRQQLHGIVVRPSAAPYNTYTMH
jgi:hypothetical protein